MSKARGKRAKLEDISSPMVTYAYLLRIDQHHQIVSTDLTTLRRLAKKQLDLALANNAITATEHEKNLAALSCAIERKKYDLRHPELSRGVNDEGRLTWIERRRAKQREANARYQARQKALSSQK